LVAGLVAVTALAQSPAAAEPAANSISGTVLNDRTGLPLARAHVMLEPAEAGRRPIAADTDDKGAFSIRGVEPGRYSLSASRDGYLTASAAWMGNIRLQHTFWIPSKDVATGVTFRLRPFAVLAGRISLEDGEPAMNIRVEAYREYRHHLRHGYELAGSAATDDRGDYRLFGLQPGSYIVAVAAQPGVSETQTLRYTTTYYANATKLADAPGPARLWAGERRHRCVDEAR
jgi:hypothetical protein